MSLLQRRQIDPCPTSYNLTSRSVWSFWEFKQTRETLASRSLFSERIRKASPNSLINTEISVAMRASKTAAKPNVFP
ncbi:hypothetical protein AN958_12568 [Leucoagaricus sp. SymC.cos]|nr:hypothetical protein AN958_12568 [Leucoagaricus sp. SymC.cos]